MEKDGASGDDVAFLSKLETVLKEAEESHTAKSQLYCGIQGLKFTRNFLTLEEESSLFHHIDNEQWNNKLLRRTQHYGYVYDYTTRNLREKAPPIPSWCNFVIDRLLEQRILVNLPDQLIVNEYLPGQGISPHIDSVIAFQDGIVSISLGADAMMDLINTRDSTNKKQVLLSSRSAISFHDVARYEWKHGISAKKKGYGAIKGRRVSLTFRKIIPEDKKRIKLIE